MSWFPVLNLMGWSKAGVATPVDASNPLPVQDDYSSVLYLEQQTSTALQPLLTFNFPQPVRKVWLRLMAANADDTSTATVRADGGDPTATLGTVIDAGVTFPISTPPTTVVKVLPPVGKTVAAYGHTR